MNSVGKAMVLAAALAFAGVAEARSSGGHGGGGRGASHGGAHSHSYARPHYGGPRVFVGVPYCYPYRRYYYYPAPAYYNPVPYYAAPYYAPPVQYIEQGQGGPGDLFYCAQSEAYYPDVLQCPAGWQRIPPPPFSN